MRYGLFAAIALAFVALVGGAASAGVATTDLGKATATALSASIVQEAGWKGRCYSRCRHHGHSRHHCRRKCHRWWH
jgi:hypothetical protein